MEAICRNTRVDYFPGMRSRQFCFALSKKLFMLNRLITSFMSYINYKTNHKIKTGGMFSWPSFPCLRRSDQTEVPVHSYYGTRPEWHGFTRHVSSVPRSLHSRPTAHLRRGTKDAKCLGSTGDQDYGKLPFTVLGLVPSFLTSEESKEVWVIDSVFRCQDGGVPRRSESECKSKARNLKSVTRSTDDLKSELYAPYLPLKKSNYLSEMFFGHRL